MKAHIYILGSIILYSRRVKSVGGLPNLCSLSESVFTLLHRVFEIYETRKEAFQAHKDL